MTDEQKQEMDSLISKVGGITRLRPIAVIKAAKNPSSALHDAFTWDVQEAAEKRWLDEARNLIRTYVYFEPLVERNIRRFVSLPEDRSTGQGYRRSLDVIRKASWQRSIQEEVVSKVSAFRRQYAYLTQLDPLWDDLEKAAEDFFNHLKPVKRSKKTA